MSDEQKTVPVCDCSPYPNLVAAAALSIVARLRTAELSCRDRYVNPHRESASLPVVRELAETVAALAVLVAELTQENEK